MNECLYSKQCHCMNHGWLYAKSSAFVHNMCRNVTTFRDKWHVVTQTPLSTRSLGYTQIALYHEDKCWYVMIFWVKWHILGCLFMNTGLDHKPILYWTVIPSQRLSAGVFQVFPMNYLSGTGFPVGVSTTIFLWVWSVKIDIFSCVYIFVTHLSQRVVVITCVCPLVFLLLHPSVPLIHVKVIALVSLLTRPIKLAVRLWIYGLWGGIQMHQIVLSFSYSLSHLGIPGVTLCFCTGSYATAAGRRFLFTR